MWLLASAALGGLFGCTGEAGRAEPAPSADTRPNVVVVLVDDMRWDDYGAAGHAFVETPNIDRIAREGTTFVNAFTVTPLCSPSRASFLTGLYPHAHGIIDNTSRGPRSHELDTFPRRLRAAGYETAFVGKWHMGRDDSARPGFDFWVSMQGQGRNVNPTIIESDRRAEVQGHVTGIFTERAIEFLERDRDGPFLLYLAHKALHPGRGGLVEGVFTASASHAGRYQNAPIERRRPNYGIAPTDKPALLRLIDDLPPLGAETVTPDATIRNRAEMLLGVDESLGQILETLEAKALLDETVVVVTSDHGYFYGEHGLNAERRFAYEESIRIPFLIRYPALAKPGTSAEKLVLSIDLAATLLELGGASTEGVQGRTLTPVLAGDASDWRSSFVIEHHTDPESYLGRSPLRRARNMGYRALRTGRYKYIHYTELEGMDELYDLERDPYELENIIDSPEAQDTLGFMKSELGRLLDSTT
jgi:N-acetylglucosamine-6-sulfatase